MDSELASARLRPDMFDLIGADYDQPAGPPAQQTLLICAAPRTGSTELGRLLTAAGLGIPHEYFNPRWAPRLAARWSMSDNPLDARHLREYIQALRSRRSRNGLLAIKLQHWQFEGSLRNEHGEALFRDARVVYLFRPDVGAQLTSFRRAMATGQWDFSTHRSSEPVQEGLDEAFAALDHLIAEDAGFRRLFALLGINPIFLTMDDIGKRPHEVVDTLARLFDLPVDRSGLDQMLAASTAYSHHYEFPTSQEYSEAFRKRAFQSP